METMVSIKNYAIVTKGLLLIGLASYVVASSTSNKTNNTKELLKPIIEKFQNEFEMLKNEELQVTAINNLYGSLKFLNKPINAHKRLEVLSEKLMYNLNTIHTSLEKAKDSFKVHNGTSTTKYLQSLVIPCKENSNEDILSKIGESLTNHSSKYSINQILNDIFYDLWSMKSSLKQVYFLSPTDTLPFDDSHSADMGCKIDHTILWNTYVSHNMYRTRRIILLIDHGNSMEDNVLHLGKLFAKQMISMLTDNDKFTLIAIASRWSSLSIVESCGNEHLPSILAATENNKQLSYNFLDGLMSKNEITDHNIGMKIAMKMARLFYAGDETVMLLHISPGVEFSIPEAMDIVAMSDISSPLIINTCAVSLGILPDVQDMNMLSDIVNDFFMEKNKSRNQLISRGRLVFINQEHLIGPAVVKLYEVYNRKLHQTTIKTSLPTWDPVSKDLSLTFSIGFPVGSRLVVIGIDVFFTKFIRDIIYYTYYQKDMYAILMNAEGKVLLHPSIPIEKHENQIKFADISKFVDEVSMRKMFLQIPSGNYSTKSSLNYIWQNINNTYVLCLVTEVTHELPTSSKISWLPNIANSKLVSYLLDLASGSNSCKYLGPIANLEAPSLYLSQSCFQNPSSQTNESLTLKLLPYVQHESLLMKHDGLQEGIRDELSGLIQVTEFLQKKHVTSVNSNYIVRRYIATKSGILHIFPGVTLEHGFEPSKRPWFIHANELRGKLVLSSPYLDSGGAGYIVTISIATPYLVLGIDVTYGFILKLILDKNPDCLNNTCFLVDDRGYLISHPELITSLESETEPIEQLHIVHIESSLANDLLNYDEIIEKIACNDYTTATIQRYYQLNMNYADILTSLVLGEPCISYAVSPIMHTNLFFGIIKATCPITRTFCPCSVIDRLCLNCQHMEEKECECPCECPVQRSSCSSYTSHDDYKLCSPVLEGYSSDALYYKEYSSDLEECFLSDCEKKATYLSCLGVIGCEWCDKDTYGFPLDSPFCTSMSTCFNGVLDGPNPYKDGNIETTHIFSSMKNTGFILGFLVVFAVVTISIFVFWRTYNNGPQIQRTYLSARQEEQLHMSDLNINDDFLEQGTNSDKLLIDDKKGTPVSPYCVTSNYSRPTTAADSDHGYSTMTPHDESEHLSLAPVEVDSLEDDMASDRTTPPPKHKALLTKIPHKNYLIVPVTVHRHIDAT